MEEKNNFYEKKKYFYGKTICMENKFLRFSSNCSIENKRNIKIPLGKVQVFVLS